MKMTEKQIEARAKAEYEAYYGVRNIWKAEADEKIKEFWRGIATLRAARPGSDLAPGAPLTDREWGPIAYCIRKWERDNRKPFGDIRDAINAVLAKRNVAQPVDGDMVDQMLVCIYGPKCGGWEPELRRRMAAAARILLDALCGPVTPEEREEARGLYWEESIVKIIDRRIDRILRPKKQTPVEMVTELIDAYRGGVAKELSEKIIEKLEAHHDK